MLVYPKQERRVLTRSYDEGEWQDGYPQGFNPKRI
jgi:hypothetical protein